MQRSPHIWIAGLFATGGLSVLNLFHPANANKNLQASEISELTPSSLEAGTSELNSKNKEKVKSTNEYSPPMELELRADRQSYDARQKRYIAEGSVTATLNGAFLKADRIEFDRNFRTLLANGRVRFKKGGQYFQATSFSYSLIQKRGELKDVYGVIDLESLDKDLKLLSDGKIRNVTSERAAMRLNFEELRKDGQN